jgi:hypothetical protein
MLQQVDNQVQNLPTLGPPASTRAKVDLDKPATSLTHAPHDVVLVTTCLYPRSPQPTECATVGEPTEGPHDSTQPKQEDLHKKIDMQYV